MEFSPNNPVVQLCMQGMNMEDEDQPAEATALFSQAWTKATNDFEKFLAAWYLARRQSNVSDRLQWLKNALQLALKLNNDAVKSAFFSLHANLAKCYNKLGDLDNTKKHHDLGLVAAAIEPTDKGPFYHGTRADLQAGDLLTAGRESNYQEQLMMNHIYFTAVINGAGLAAALAKGGGAERIFIIEPLGSFENDPNVTNKKFPGNPTRSYRTQHPLKIVGEVTEWVKPTTEQLQHWRDKLSNSKGEIIN